MSHLGLYIHPMCHTLQIRGQYNLKIVCTSPRNCPWVSLYILYCCASVTVIKKCIYSSRKFLLIFSNLTFDAVMLFLCLRWQSPLCPSFVSPMMKEQKIYYLYHCNDIICNNTFFCQMFIYIYIYICILYIHIFYFF